MSDFVILPFENIILHFAPEVVLQTDVSTSGEPYWPGVWLLTKSPNGVTSGSEEVVDVPPEALSVEGVDVVADWSLPFCSAVLALPCVGVVAKLVVGFCL